MFQIGVADLDAMEVAGRVPRERILVAVKQLREEGATQVYIRAARGEERKIPRNLLLKIVQMPQMLLT